MKDIYVVIRQKEAQIETLRQDCWALCKVIKMLAEAGDTVDVSPVIVLEKPKSLVNLKRFWPLTKKER